MVDGVINALLPGAKSIISRHTQATNQEAEIIARKLIEGLLETTAKNEIIEKFKFIFMRGDVCEECLHKQVCRTRQTVMDTEEDGQKIFVSKCKHWRPQS